ncbi:MAG: hypothetical protein R3D44_03410 [Hyphomicrobiaceae bacterium]
MKFICGNSHTIALSYGQRRLANADSASLKIFPLGSGQYETTPFSEVRGSGVVFLEPSYSDNLRRFAGTSEIRESDDTWGFCLVNHNVRIYRHPMWKLYSPCFGPGFESKFKLSNAAIDLIVDADSMHIKSFLDQLLRLKINFFAISAPYPREDHPCILSGTKREIVAHLDEVARGRWSKWLSDRGILCVDPPTETRGSDGFLKSEFNAPHFPSGKIDPHHANAEYGRMMLQKIISVTSGTGSF